MFYYPVWRLHCAQLTGCHYYWIGVHSLNCGTPGWIVSTNTDAVFPTADRVSLLLNWITHLLPFSIFQFLHFYICYHFPFYNFYYVVFFGRKQLTGCHYNWIGLHSRFSHMNNWTSQPTRMHFWYLLLNYNLTYHWITIGFFVL